MNLALNPEKSIRKSKKVKIYFTEVLHIFSIHRLHHI